MRRPAALAMAALLAPMPSWGVRPGDGGIGQVLLYPYYSTRDGAGGTFNTYLSVINASNRTKALRVRFREGRNGRDAASFNLYLSPNDTWTAAIVPQGSGARLVTADRSCTDPAIGTGLDFSAAGYSGANFDAAGDGLDRTREGYIEILEMATLIGAAASGVTQNGSGVPVNCAATRNIGLADVAPPTGDLLGSLTLINVADGSDYSVNATALADVASRPYFRQPEDPYPSLAADEIDPVSLVAHDRAIYRSVWTRGLDAVNAVLTRSYVSAEFVLDAATRSTTDVVVNFPTRPLATADAPAPFANAAGWSQGCAAGESMPVVFFNREGGSPLPGSPFENVSLPEWRACGPAGVITVDKSGSAESSPSLFGSGGGSISASLAGAQASSTLRVSSNFENGYLAIAPQGMIQSLSSSTRLDVATGTLSSGAHTYAGLPVIGFMARSLRNGTLACPGATACQGNYGSAFPLRYARTITP